MQEKNISNPWLGLQTYTESDVLYGRDNDIRILSQYIFSDSETVLYGKSGIGKSSLLNAGIVPLARMKGYVPVTIRLVHEQNAVSYTSQIIEKIESCGIKFEEGFDTKSMNLWNLFHLKQFEKDGSPCPLLIIFDQFEEIFTLQQNSQKKMDFFHELADVINDINPSSPSSIDTTSTVPTLDGAGGGDNFLDDIDLEIPDNSQTYYNNNEIHLVFTLREDFLSEFEYYTAAIPSLKQHRYGLRPMNEEQAAEVILSPRFDLVSKDVAKLIIEKVTKRTDFSLDGVPEIEVDVAVLSLYLSKLYEKSDKQCITAELVEKEAGNIIREFYEDCINTLPTEVVDKLEKILVNKEGHREIISLKGLSNELGIEGCVEDLIKKKLLRTFKYAGEEKIELIHDVLCDVVKNRKEEKEKQEQIERERVALKHQNVRNKRRIYALTGFLCITLLTIIFLVLRNQELQNNEGFGVHQEFTVKLIEDSPVTSDNEHWKAHLLIIALEENKSDTIYNKDVNKSYKDSTFRLVSDSVKAYTISLVFDGKKNRKYYKNIIHKEIPVGFFTKNKELALNVCYDDSKMIKYEGHVAAAINGELIDLKDAMVILRDLVRHTDAKGNFSFIFEDSLKSDECILFARKGLYTEDSLYEKGKLISDFILIPSDSLSTYKSLCQRADSIKYFYNSTIGVELNEGGSDRLTIHANVDKSVKEKNGKVFMRGYFYFHKEHRKYDGDEYNLSYYHFTGWMKSSWTNNLKDIEFEGYNKVNNKLILSGWRKKNDGNFFGLIIDTNKTIGSFGKDD